MNDFLRQINPVEPLESIPGSSNLDIDDGNDGSYASDNSETSDTKTSSGSNVRYISSGAEEVKPINEMETASAIFDRFHKKPSSLLPSNLPGKPASFQAYLTSVFKDPGNTNEKRVALHLASGSTRGHGNSTVRAFVAASFPPIKVGSFAGERIDYTFEGDAFPQFTQIEKSNFSCAICIPHLK